MTATVTEQHQRCPYCGTVMVGRVCSRCDARADDSPLQAGEGAPGGGVGCSRPGCFGDEGMTMNYGQLRTAAKIIVNNAGSYSAREYMFASVSVRLLDEIEQLRSELKAVLDFVESKRPGEFHFGAAEALLGGAP